MVFQKIKHKKIFIISVIIAVFLGINAFTMKGFYNTLNYPNGTLGFINNGYCFSHGIPGGKDSKLNQGRGYILSPETMDDYEKCGDSYVSILWTFVAIDHGQWIGVHVGPCLVMVETRWREDEGYWFTEHSKKLGFPYYIMWYHGKKAGFTKFEKELYFKQTRDIMEKEEAK